MSRIPEDIMTLGLIVKTRPFTYENNVVNCSFEDYIEIDDLVKLKTNLESELENIPDNLRTDELVRSYNDDIYFIVQVIQSLENA